jgi:ATP-dependent protease ClpP protease subunit
MNNGQQPQNNQIVQIQDFKHLSIQIDEEQSKVKLFIHGEIEEPEEYINELMKLHELSEKYDTLEIIINSPGGSVNTFVELYAIIKKFPFVITIGMGEIASAGFMLWSLGDVRVVSKFSMYMAHRESYGYWGKTEEHEQLAKTYNVNYKKLFDECFSKILTDKEKELSKVSEVWIPYDELIKRGVAISYDEYLKYPREIVFEEIYLIEGKYFKYDKKYDKFIEVEIKPKNNFIKNLNKYAYGFEKIKKLYSEKSYSTNKKRRK